MKFTLPLPPTANLYWRIFRGRAIQSADAKNYKRMVAFRAMNQDISSRPKPIDGDVVVTMTVYGRWKQGDLDNFQKCLLDALRGIAFHDDKQVVEIHARREDDPTNPRVEIRVEPATQATEF
jgi:crossover junction endodeoxyribonuclease RusA